MGIEPKTSPPRRTYEGWGPRPEEEVVKVPFDLDAIGLKKMLIIIS